MATGVSFQGYREQIATFQKGDSVTAGYPVCVTANDTVTDCADGALFDGLAVTVERDAVGVQTSGFVTAAYDSAAIPALGSCFLCAAASGKVKKTDAGRIYTVISLDTDAQTVSFLL